jgi:hypothetical protein
LLKKEQDYSAVEEAGHHYQKVGENCIEICNKKKPTQLVELRRLFAWFLMLLDILSGDLKKRMNFAGFKSNTL